MDIDRNQLEQVKEWAIENAQEDGVPPWALYQYMKLREALEAITAGLDSTAVDPNLTQQTEDSLEEVPLGENVLPLRAAVCPQGSVPRRNTKAEIHLPT